MEVLWAPWRMEYVAAVTKPQGCIFCDYPAEPLEHHRELLLLRVDDDVLVILNRYPFNNGHLMVVPRAHVRWPSRLEESAQQALDRALRRAIALVRTVLEPEGINVGMNLGRAAGAGFDEHLHWHVVPRWNGDTNFMPVVAETKVMPEHVLATYDRLSQAMQQEEQSE